MSRQTQLGGIFVAMSFVAITLWSTGRADDCLLQCKEVKAVTALSHAAGECAAFVDTMCWQQAQGYWMTPPVFSHDWECENMTINTKMYECKNGCKDLCPDHVENNFSPPNDFENVCNLKFSKVQRRECVKQPQGSE